MRINCSIPKSLKFALYPRSRIESLSAFQLYVELCILRQQKCCYTCIFVWLLLKTWTTVQHLSITADGLYYSLFSYSFVQWSFHRRRNLKIVCSNDNDNNSSFHLTQFGIRNNVNNLTWRQWHYLFDIFVQSKWSHDTQLSKRVELSDYSSKEIDLNIHFSGLKFIFSRNESFLISWDYQW